MRLMLLYSLRNLFRRRLTTFFSVLGMALVIFVFSAVTMLTEGLRQTLVKTGDYDNVIILRKSSQAEMQSVIDREQANVVETLSEIKIGSEGRRLISKEVVTLISLIKKSTGKPSNVTIRGIDENSFNLRRGLKVISGRLPVSGSNEIIIGKSISKNFTDAEIGKPLFFGSRSWLVVGIFDAGNTGFSSEVWCDVNQLMQAFRRSAYSSITFKLNDNINFNIVKEKIETDPRLTLEVKREVRYYEEQSEVMATFISYLGISMTVIFSVGAVLGAMITMYTAVANRENEIGTLRAIGFSRRQILWAFLSESLLISILGFIFGLFFSSFLQFYTISTLNWQTFSELAFSFKLSPKIFSYSLLFAIAMGVSGGLFPAIRASRKNIIEVLRTG
ncbi:MAG: ABC transporter permease [Proteobacteria bacterium]|nr:ABC transporter permease [Pseudomonadota bacterium]